MKLYYIENPRQAINGQVGNTFFNNGRSEVMGRKDAQRLMAYIGGILKEIDFGSLDLDEMILLAANQEATETFLETLKDQEECTCEEDDACDKCPEKEVTDPQADAAKKLVDDALNGDNEARKEIINTARTTETVDEVAETKENHDIVVDEITPAQVENLAEEEDIDLPSYNEMKAAIASANADEEFDFDSREIIGTKADKASIQKAYLLLQLKKSQGETE